MKITTDREGNPIGNGNYHCEYSIEEFNNSSIISNVSLSETTESVYVTYTNINNDKKITVRFSDHINNSVQFGDQLDGLFTTRNEILYHLGLKQRKFIPLTRLCMNTQQISKKKMSNFEMSNLTISQIYAFGAGADISAHTGKLAKDSNYLILGSKIEELEESYVNRLGYVVRRGKYIYAE